MDLFILRRARAIAGALLFAVLTAFSLNGVDESARPRSTGGQTHSPSSGEAQAGPGALEHA